MAQKALHARAVGRPYYSNAQGRSRPERVESGATFSTSIPLP
jgi:hypothetical protein